MKPILFSLLAWLIAFGASAKLNGDGYYRVQNYTSKRYVYVMDDKGSLDFQSTTAEVGAIELWMGADRVISDPASVIYIKAETGNTSDFDFQTQGTGVKSMISHPVSVRLRDASREIYAIYGRDSGLTRWLGDGTKNKTSERGYMSTTDSGEWTYWQIFPVGANSSEYFGITPTIQVGGSYYQPFYADFPFRTESTGMTVYIVTKVDEDIAVLKEMSGVVPKGTPVLIKCSNDKPTANRLTLGGTPTASTSGNLLRGIYFENYDKLLHNNLTPYNKQTMRLLRKNDKGELAFVAANDVDYLPRNQAYLPVSADTPDQLRVMTQAEYDSYMANRTYKLTYMVDGEVYKTFDLKAGATITPETAPQKTGHSFSGWQGLPATMPRKDVTVTGSFTVNSYNLAYYLDDQLYESQTVKYGASLSPIAAPNREGYSFSGWVGLPKTMPANDVKVTGSMKINTYTATFMVDDKEYARYEVTFNSKIPAVQDPVKEGYTFKGWDALPELMPARNIVINAKFEGNPYKITYMLEGELYSTATVICGGTITPEPAPEKVGHTFSGWQGLPAQMPARDITVNGSFIVNHYNLVYILDGVNYKSYSVEYGAVIIPEPDPVKEGFRFSGWRGVPEVMPAEDVRVYGNFGDDIYSLTYLVDGEVYAIVQVKPGENVVPIDEPEKEGHSFSGWHGIPDVMPRSDIEVTGSFSPISYQLSVYIDGSLFHQAMVPFGEKVVIPKLEIPSDREVDYWSESIPATMPSHDVALYVYTKKAGIDDIFSDSDPDSTVDVYSIDGHLIMKQATRDNLRDLAPGLYIIGGRKVHVM